MIVLPGGMPIPKPVSAKLQPTPRITSALCRKCCTGCGIGPPPEPSDSGWFSGNALLPSRLVVTGMLQRSARSLSSAQASRVVHALAGVDHRAPRAAASAAALRTSAGSGPHCAAQTGV